MGLLRRLRPTTTLKLRLLLRKMLLPPPRLLLLRRLPRLLTRKLSHPLQLMVSLGPPTCQSTSKTVDLSPNKNPRTRLRRANPSPNLNLNPTANLTPTLSDH